MPGRVILLCLMAPLLMGAVACDRTPEPPAGPPASGQNIGGTSEAEGSSTVEETADGTSDRPPCLVPLSESPAPPASSVEDCPPDPDGRPDMPWGRVVFPEADADERPELAVELALNDEHRAHGLMYRPELDDEHGMLFSWREDEVRSFWMRNTCLALDMLFIDRAGFVTGVVEQVPPMNDAHRSIPCPVAHVLEVPAGWVRRHGVRPGHRVVIEP